MTNNTDNGFVIGTRTSGDALVLDENTRRRHLHITGQTGTGKSTLIRNMIAQDLMAGRGLALIDPLGDLAQAALESFPASRHLDLAYFDTNDLTRPFGFNVLDGVEPERQATVTDDVVSAFVNIFGEQAIGPETQRVLRNSLRALMDTPGMTLLGVPKLLAEERFRAQITRRVRDPVVASYWRDRYANYDQRRRLEITDPISNKLDAFLSTPALRNIIAQPKSSIDLRKTMDDGRVLIVNLNKGLFGQANTRLLGSLLITRLSQAAFARADTPVNKRRLFYLYADEFQDFASSAFGRILSQSRNFGLALTLSHQYLGQLSDELRQATFGNAGSYIALRVGGEDSRAIAEHLGLESEIEIAGMGQHEILPEKRLISLANFTAYARLLIDDAPTEPMLLHMLPPTTPINHRPHRMIAASRQRFGRDRAKVEDAIARFLRV